MPNSPTTHPIIFHWIKQYPHNKDAPCDLCKNKRLKTIPLARYAMDHYVDLTLPFNSGVGMLFVDQMEKDIWRKAVKDQRVNDPHAYQTWYLCAECTNWLVAGFLGKEFRLPPPFDELPKPLRPEQEKLSWVLFRRQSDPDTPLMMFTMSDFPIRRVVEQGQNILRSGNIQ